MKNAEATVVTHRDVVVVSLVTFLMGAALASIVLIGGRYPLKCFDGGNVADWLAAMGTWVIGLAAAYYAHQSHLQRMHEIEERKSVERDTRRSHLLTAILALSDAICIVSTAEKFLLLPAEEHNYARLRLTLEALRRIAAPVVISIDALKHMPPKAATGVARINGGLAAVHGLIRTIEIDGGSPPEDRALVSQIDEKMMRHILDTGKEVAQECEAFRQLGLRAIAEKARR